MSKSFHHKTRRFDFAETRAGKARDCERRLARAMKGLWLDEALTTARIG